LDCAEALARHDPDGSALIAQAQQKLSSSSSSSGVPTSEEGGGAGSTQGRPQTELGAIGGDDNSTTSTVGQDLEPAVVSADSPAIEPAAPATHELDLEAVAAGSGRSPPVDSGAPLGREPEPVIVEAAAATAARSLRLVAACAAGDMEMVLAELGAEPPPDLTALTVDGDTAVHMAIRGGHTAVFRTLVIHGASPFQRTSPLERTCLHAAVEAGDAAAAVTLVREFGLPLNSSDRDGKTPMHLAAELGHTKLAETLIWAQSSSLTKLCEVLDATDATGATPADVAVAAEHTECAATLQRYRNMCRVVDAGAGALAVNAEYVCPPLLLCSKVAQLYLRAGWFRALPHRCCARTVVL
jgi:ankyrin repeat protein